MSNFWSSENYIKARVKKGIDGNHPYFVRSSRAIEDIAKKIVEEVKK